MLLEGDARERVGDPLRGQLAFQPLDVATSGLEEFLRARAERVAPLRSRKKVGSTSTAASESVVVRSGLAPTRCSARCVREVGVIREHSYKDTSQELATERELHKLEQAGPCCVHWCVGVLSYWLAGVWACPSQFSLNRSQGFVSRFVRVSGTKVLSAGPTPWGLIGLCRAP